MMIKANGKTQEQLDEEYTWEYQNFCQECGLPRWGDCECDDGLSCQSEDGYD